MRAREILQEDYNQSLESDLNNILIGAKGSNINQLNTQDIANKLYSMGYSIDINSILPLLGNSPVVQSATPQMITLTSQGDTSSDGNSQDSAEQVSDMAQAATKIG